MTTYQLKVSIDETEPLVWRRIIVPDRITFHQLHLIIQQIYGWQDYHLYQFEIPGIEEPIRRFFDDPFINDGVLCDGRDEFIDAYLSEGLRFSYVYDMGDYWEHIIDVEKIDVRGSSRVPKIIDFWGDCLLEDSGGVGGYYEKMKILENPKHPKYREILAWAEWRGMKKFNVESVNAIMDEIMYFPIMPTVPEMPRLTHSGPRVSLDAVVEAFSYQSERLAAYVDLDTGEVRMLFLDRDAYDSDGMHELYDKPRAEYESCRSLLLPKPDSSEDYRIMRGFADCRDEIVRERLLRAIEGRGAFKRFKNEVSKLGLEQQWREFRNEAYRDIARDFLEASGIRWI